MEANQRCDLALGFRKKTEEIRCDKEEIGNQNR
jgi:hypothetical protein